MPDASSLMTMQQIRYLYNLQKANVTASYDSTVTYEIGDYCLYLGILYRCISTISTAEDFDSSHWVSTNVDAELDRIETTLRINPLVIDIPSGQWSGSGNDYYYSVTASNVTANSILVPNYDGASAGYLRGPVWCVPAAGSFTIHTSAIPSGTVKIMVQIVGTIGEANYQVLSDVYSKSQTYSKSEAVAKADIVNNLTSTSITAPLSAAQGKALNEAIPLSTKLGGKQVQWGHKEISLAANSQTEITVTMPLNYQGGNDYMAIVTPVIYTAANTISFIIRDKTSASFVVRIYNAGGSAANGYLDWITIGL